MKKAPQPAPPAKLGRVLDQCDFVGGQILPHELVDFRSGIGVLVFLCGGCDAKHLAISVIENGVRHTVTIHGNDAIELASFIPKALASS